MKKIILPLIALICLIVTTTITYAWITDTDSTKSFTINSANVDSRLYLYEGLDFNKDGILDKELIDNEYVDTYVQITNDDTITKESKDISLTLDDLYPTKIYTYKVSIENWGDVDAYLSLNCNQEVFNEVRNYFSLVSISYKKVTDEEFSQKVYFNTLEDSYIFGGTINELVSCEASKNKEEYIIRFEVETYQNLVDNNIIEDTNDNYLDYLNKMGSAIESSFLTFILSSTLSN